MLLRVLRVGGLLLAFSAAVSGMVTTGYAVGAELLYVDLRILDIWFKTRSVLHRTNIDVVIIAEDDRSATELRADGSLYRKHHPMLMQRLTSDSTIRVVAFDHNFETVTPFDTQFAEALRRVPD